VQIQKIKLKNFRIHTNYEEEFDSKTNLIVGPNGTGKTSALEAIYIACLGKSFRSSLVETIQKDKPWARIDLLFKDSSVRTIKLTKQENNRVSKIFSVAGEESKSIKQKDKLPVVVFEPGDTQIVVGSPQRRRDYLDTTISVIDETHRKTINKYKRYLQQRNNLLKRGVAKSELFPWDIQVASAGDQIRQKRGDMIKEINTQISSKYQEISNSKDTIRLETPKTPSNMLKQLEINTDRDRRLGSTSNGPHTDNIKIRFNHGLAKDVASRGEIRTTLLALKSIEIETFTKCFNTSPIILLDDVFSELDDSRAYQVGKIFDKNQVIATDVNEDY